MDLTLSRALGPEHGFTLRDQWRDGHVEWDQVGSWFVGYPQFIDPDPAIVGNVQYVRETL